MLRREEIVMELNGIDATLNQLVSQLPKGLGKKTGAANFESLIETLKTQIKAAIEEATRGTAAPVSAPAVPTAPISAAPTPAASSVPTARTTSQLTPYQQSLLKNPDGPLYELLPNELTSASPLYNEREALMRQELNLDGIEAHLKSKAKELEVEYDRSDLDGILRNSGYGAAHLGSTERYMAAVQKFIGEAENNYRQRSSNIPGSKA
jgi:hypothetical protein